MVAVIDPVAFGDHAIFLLGVDGDISGKVPLLQQFTKGALAVTVSPAKDTGINGSRSSKSGTAFDSRSEAWVTPWTG